MFNVGVLQLYIIQWRQWGAVEAKTLPDILIEKWFPFKRIFILFSFEFFTSEGPGVVNEFNSVLLVMHSLFSKSRHKWRHIEVSLIDSK